MWEGLVFRKMGCLQRCSGWWKGHVVVNIQWRSCFITLQICHTTNATTRPTQRQRLTRSEDHHDIMATTLSEYRKIKEARRPGVYIHTQLLTAPVRLVSASPVGSDGGSCGCQMAVELPFIGDVFGPPFVISSPLVS